MKTKSFTLIFTLLFSITVNVFSESLQTTKPMKTTNKSGNYDELWKEIAYFDELSLPTSADETAEKIYQKALAEKNSPELLKAVIHKIKYGLKIDDNRFPELIKELEKYTSNTNDLTEQSVLYSMLAQLYLKYFSENYYQINQRTAITGYTPEDIREWSNNIFFQKISDYIESSVKEREKLESTNVLIYKNILTTGESSRTLRPTLYDFLIHQGIDLLNQMINYDPSRYFYQTKFNGQEYFNNINDFIKMTITTEPYDLTNQTLSLYQRSLLSLQERKEGEAILFDDLDRLEFVYNQSEGDQRDENYLNALSMLEKQYENKEICVEVLYKKAIYYRQSFRNIIPLKVGPEADIANTNEGNKNAYLTCLHGIDKYPKYERISLLINLKNDLTQSEINTNSSNTVYPGQNLKLAIKHKNTEKLTVKIYKIDSSPDIYENYWNREGKYKENGKLVEKQIIQLNNEFPYIQYDTTINIPLKDLGNYEFVIFTEKDMKQIANQQFSVSRLTSVSRSYDNKYEFLVTDRMSGKPIEGAKINFYKKERNKNIFAGSLTTGKDGIAIKNYDNNEELNGYNITLGNDTALSLSSLPWRNTFADNDNQSIIKLDIFTDRSIYRPGQTVYFKAIAYEIGSGQNKILKGQTYTIYLRDPNGKNLSSKLFTSSEYGSFSGEFTLPYSGLNGNFSVGTDKYNERAYFKMEEYKRPTFDITFEPVKETYNFGDQVSVKGNVKTFSGVNIQNTKVRYRIIQRQHWLWRWYYPGGENQVAQDIIETDDDGNFRITFPAEKRFNDQKRNNVFYTYEIQATVTDSKGESQETKTNVSIGDRSMYLSGGLEGNLNKNDLHEVTISSFNLNNQKVKSSGTYEIYSLKGEESLENTLASEKWETDRLVISGDFTSDEIMNINDLKKINSGRYRMIIKAKDDKGRDVDAKSDFILFSEKDKHPPIVSYEWLLTPKTTCNVGEKAEIYYGSSAKNVYVLYEIFHDNKKLETNRFMLNNSIQKIEIPFKESYGDGIAVNLTFIKDAKVFQQNIPVTKKKEDKNLTIQTEVFRDKLLPGQKEIWKISIKDAEGNAVDAETLAGMYDASLDKIFKHSWSFYPVWSKSITSPYFSSGNDFRDSYSYISIPNTYLEIPQFSFDSFNWFGLSLQNYSIRIRGTGNRLLKSAVPQQEMVMETAMDNVAAVIPQSFAESKADLATGGMIEEDGTDMDLQENNIRENFNETAFFYPQLKTNAAGETIISFTVPESNTSWKFITLSHTKDLKYGQLVKEVISQKKLMVSPNMPRFIRQGDKTTINADISNLSDLSLTGTASIEFFDPNTEKKTIIISEPERKFSLEPGRTTTVSWTFDIPENLDITACKIIAQTEQFSDGEQHLLPVLPNKILVTETLPLTSNERGTRNFKFDKLLNNKSESLQNYRLTLEFTDNPIWYAIQALPAMSAPSNENVLNWFASYYSNSLATNIANKNPKIKQTINAWSKQNTDKKTLESNLEKNQELKNILLEETPWIMDAKNESEQRQQLLLLFDENRSANLTSSALSKLKELQKQDGGWSWFKGMQSSISITQWLLYGMGQLENMGVEDLTGISKDMQTEALSFIDRKFADHFEQLKKYDKNWNKKNSFSRYELEYLFIRSFYDTAIDSATNSAIDFYTGIIEKYWNKNNSFYDKAIASIIMKRADKSKIADNIIRSLREHATIDKDNGMYWANNNANAFMFQSATAIHTFIMQAFIENGATNEELNKMKTWLLKQKQTQLWESTPATVNAVSVLMDSGTDWLDTNQNTTVYLGKEKIQAESKETGTGYYKKAYESADIKPEMGSVSLINDGNKPSWGALYWQYYEQTDRINSSGSDLQIERKLFVEKTTNSGKTIESVNASDKLKIGDKIIIRLTIRNTKDLEFVMLKDMRASCFEPAEQLSGIKFREGLVYYQTNKDASTNFYFDNLPKGTYVFEYPVYVTRTGEYSNGISNIQCIYAPEFSAHTGGERIIIE